MIISFLMLAAAQTGQSVPARPLAPPVVAPAAVPGTVVTARKLLIMMKMDQQLDYMFTNLIPVMADSMLGILESGDKTRALMLRMEQSRSDAHEHLKTIFAQEFAVSIKKRYPALFDAAAKEYAAAFSEGELNDLIAFYGSGTGAKALTLMPKLQVAMGSHGESIGREAGEEAGARAMERAIAEMLPPTGSSKS